MSALAKLQEGFQRFILDTDEAFPKQVLEDARGALARRLAVYRDGYRLRLLEALGTNYPALRALLGDAQFSGLCLPYIAANTSRLRNLRYYGANLAAFLATEPPARDHPVLSELAAFEWALAEAFDAPDAESLGFDAFAGLPAEAWPGLRLVLHPSVLLRLQQTNAAQIRRAQDLGEEPPLPEQLPQPLHWLIWRQDQASHFRSLPDDEAQALLAVAAQEDFTALCSQLTEVHGPDQGPARAATLLRGWVEGGLVAAIKVP